MSKEKAIKLGESLLGLNLKDPKDHAVFDAALDGLTRRVEGFKNKAYNDRGENHPNGYMTIGYGYNMQAYETPQKNIDRWHKALGDNAPNYYSVLKGELLITKEDAQKLHQFTLTEAERGQEVIYGKMLKKIPQELVAPIKLNLVSLYHNLPALVRDNTPIYDTLERYSKSHSAQDYQAFTDTIRNAYPRDTIVSNGLRHRRDEAAVTLEAAFDEHKRTDSQLNGLEYNLYAASTNHNFDVIHKRSRPNGIETAQSAHNAYYNALDNSPSWQMEGLDKAGIALWEKRIKSSAFNELKDVMKEYLHKRYEHEWEKGSALSRTEYDALRNSTGVDSAISRFEAQLRGEDAEPGIPARMAHLAKRETLKDIAANEGKAASQGQHLFDLTMETLNVIEVSQSDKAGLKAEQSQMEAARRQYISDARSKDASPEATGAALSESQKIAFNLMLGKKSDIVTPHLGDDYLAPSRHTAALHPNSKGYSP